MLQSSIKRISGHQLKKSESNVFPPLFLMNQRSTRECSLCNIQEAAARADKEGNGVCSRPTAMLVCCVTLIVWPLVFFYINQPIFLSKWYFLGSVIRFI
jgi:hypothetical protein